MNNHIAIDGPAGAGKSTIAKQVARHFSYVYVDTGAMYRTMALYMLKNSIKLDDESAISDACLLADISIRYENGEQVVYLNGENVNSFIRAEEVGNAASIISKYQRVREQLVALQQKMALEITVVMDGRDIGTVVLPDAKTKIYLTASADERARRRVLQLEEKGEKADFELIKADIIKRDEQDMNRAISPLKQADDAVLIDSSNMTIDEVVSKIIEIAGK